RRVELRFRILTDSLIAGLCQSRGAERTGRFADRTGPFGTPANDRRSAFRFRFGPEAVQREGAERDNGRKKRELKDTSQRVLHTPPSSKPLRSRYSRPKRSRATRFSRTSPGSTGSSGTPRTHVRRPVARTRETLCPRPGRFC